MLDVALRYPKSELQCEPDVSRRQIAANLTHRLSPQIDLFGIAGGPARGAHDLKVGREADQAAPPATAKTP